jgi:hypothetical protein
VSGPDYPPGPVGNPNANSIGAFEVGVSPIGTISAFDPWITVLSQYANSEALTSLITSANAALDPTEQFDSFFDLYWDIQTAVGNGLNIWGRIVGVTRTLTLAGSQSYFGFQEGQPSWTGFGPGSGGIFSSGDSLTNNYTLNDTDFRTLILAKAAANVCNGSIPAINAILLALFPGRNAYVVDGENMTMQYVFLFNLTPVQQALLGQQNVLPTPVGVAFTIVIG